MPAWLIKTGHLFQKIGQWLKGNWLLIVIIIGAIFALIFAKRKLDNLNLLVNEFKNQSAQNRANMDALKRVQDEQIQVQQEINRQYREVLDKIQKDYQSALSQLDSKKKQEILEIITQNHNDPNLMAQNINNLFNIPIMSISSLIHN